MKFAILEDLLIIFRIFLLIIFGEMDENSLGYCRKNYQKILEKREMSFCSFENKNWTF